MKHHVNCTEAGNATPPLVSVRFEFVDPSAKTVSVAGSFNQWQPGTRTLKRTRGGCWRKETALAPGTYEYKLVVDGQWMPDPLAMYYVPNPFGGKNSVIKVAATGESAHRRMKKVPRKKAGKQKGHPASTPTPGAIA
jgi:1,4-alpha-glucan branching enzyme